MKKLILMTIMLLSTLACAYSIELDYQTPPNKSGRYISYLVTLKYVDGTDMEVGQDFMYTSWKDTKWFEYHWISCKISSIHSTNPIYLVLDCTVEEREQFYNGNHTASITYQDLKGHRSDGTLKWSRDSIGSTDIYCYDRNGMTIIKRVNNPYRCK